MLPSSLYSVSSALDSSDVSSSAEGSGDSSAGSRDWPPVFSSREPVSGSCSGDCALLGSSEGRDCDSPADPDSVWDSSAAVSARVRVLARRGGAPGPYHSLTRGPDDSD